MSIWSLMKIRAKKYLEAINVYSDYHILPYDSRQTIACQSILLHQCHSTESVPYAFHHFKHWLKQTLSWSFNDTYLTRNSFFSVNFWSRHQVKCDKCVFLSTSNKHSVVTMRLNDDCFASFKATCTSPSWSSTASRCTASTSWCSSSPLKKSRKIFVNKQLARKKDSNLLWSLHDHRLLHEAEITEIRWLEYKFYLPSRIYALPWSRRHRLLALRIHHGLLRHLYRHHRVLLGLV